MSLHSIHITLTAADAFWREASILVTLVCICWHIVLSVSVSLSDQFVVWQALPAEPGAGEEDVVQVAVRMPNGSRFTRRSASPPLALPLL